MVLTMDTFRICQGNLCKLYKSNEPLTASVLYSMTLRLKTGIIWYLLLAVRLNTTLIFLFLAGGRLQAVPLDASNDPSRPHWLSRYSRCPLLLYKCDTRTFCLILLVNHYLRVWVCAVKVGLDREAERRIPQGIVMKSFASRKSFL